MFIALAPSLTAIILSMGQTNDVPDGFRHSVPLFGKTYVTNFWASKVSRTPKWDENNENPPVSARKALTLAKKMRDSVIELPNGFRWKLLEINLTPIEDGWVWFVFYHAIPEQGDDGPSARIMLIVLMDGTAVPLEVGEDVEDEVSDATQPEKTISK
jgi:hypothetical protein